MKSTMRDNITKPERTVDEAIQILWKVIEESKMYLVNEKSTSEDKRRWAKVLCDHIKHTKPYKTVHLASFPQQAQAVSEATEQAAECSKYAL